VKKLFLTIAFMLFSTLTYGETLSIIVPAADGNYTINARLVAKYLGKYLPNHPEIVIQPIPGAQSLVAANYLYNVAPKDGSVIGTLYKEIPYVGLMGGKGVQFDQTKFTVLGSTSDGRKDTIILWSKQKEFKQGLIVGVEGATTGNMAIIVDKLLDAKFKYVSGYPSAAANRLALHRNEVDSVIYNLSGIKNQAPEWLKVDSEIYPLLQFSNGKNRHSEYSNVPTLAEKINTEHLELLEAYEGQFALLRPFFAPPNIPKEKAKELQDALMKVTKDENFINDAKLSRVDVSFIDAEEAKRMIDNSANIDIKLLNKLREIYNND